MGLDKSGQVWIKREGLKLGRAFCGTGLCAVPAARIAEEIGQGTASMATARNLGRVYGSSVHRGVSQGPQHAWMGICPNS